LTQHRGRLAATQRQNLGAIDRFARLLDEAMRREALPATYSRRFDIMFQMQPIAGVIEWGGAACWAHNRLQLRCLKRNREGATKVWELELLLPGVDPDALDCLSYAEHLRWFRYGMTATAGRLVAVEEWLNHKSKTDHIGRIAVFDTITGKEVTGPSVDALTAVSDLQSVRAAIEAELSSLPVNGDTPP
jgi:hypothetical protein